MDDAQLRTRWQQRQPRFEAKYLSEPLAYLMKHKLARRVKQLGQLASLWDECIPESLREHTALEGFRNGVLTVLVDSPAQRFQLQTLLTGGLFKTIQSRYPGALNKIRLVPGQFASVDLAGQKRYEF
jgi:predicted nucleic acid-binding Zn ribbon protein